MVKNLQLSVIVPLWLTFLFLAPPLVFAASDDSIWSMGGYVGYQNFQVHKQGEETGSLMENSIGIVGENFKVFGSGAEPGWGLVSLFSVGIHEANTQTMESGNGYTTRGVGKIREAFVMYSPTLAWIMKEEPGKRSTFYVGPMAERIHLEIDAYLADSPSRNSACAQAVNDRSGIAMKANCVHVKQSTDQTVYSMQAGFYGADKTFVYVFAFQALNTYLSIRQGGYEVVRGPNPVLSMQYRF